MGSFFKKSIVAILIIALIVPSGLLIFPKKAEAVVPVMEMPGKLLIATIANLKANIISASNNIAQTGLQTGILGVETLSNRYIASLHQKEVGPAPFVPFGSWDQIANKITKMMIGAFTASLVNWIQTAGLYPGGGSGSMFIQDINRYFLSVADNTAGRFLEQILAPEIFNLLCSPFRIPLFNALRARIVLPPFPAAQCTISDIIRNLENGLGVNIGYGANSRFYDNFFYGGWGYLVNAYSPQNNYYGAKFIMENQLAKQQYNAQLQARSELSFGQGFLSWKQMEKAGTEMKCRKWSEPYNYGKRDCLMWEEVPIYKETIKTPGKVVEDQLATQFGSSVRSLEIADEINEIIAAIIQRLITEILMGGRGVAGWKTDSSSAWQPFIEAQKPDLVVSTLFYSPLNPQTGQMMSFSGNIYDIWGGAIGSMGAKLEIDVENDGTWDVSSFTTVNLGQNGAGLVSWQNVWSAISGHHKFRICADPKNSVEESNEDNNCNDMTFDVPNLGILQADLIVERVDFSPQVTSTGELMTFRGTVRNTGVTDATQPSTTRLRIDVGNNGSWDTNANANTDLLLPNETEEEVWTDAWTATLGTHKFEICADVNNTVIEGNENNNCATRVFEVIRRPDLIISSIALSPSYPDVNDDITFTTKVKNQGDTTSTPSTTRARIDLQSNGSWDITLVPDQATGQLVPGIEEIEIWIREIGLAGQHKIEVCADIGNSVIESQEGNNCSSLNFYVSYW